MLVDIDKIIVNDRIRKDFGDIQELADDIKENGLINPPVVNKGYELLAGERRLRACKMLGWPQIEVRMMDTRDAEHELNIEISENDVRKGFTKSERVDYIKRLLRIEQAKAKERQGERTSASNNTEVQRSDDATAKAFDMSATTMRRELFIADNQDLLDPADFADWDEGKLSTNKTFKLIKAAKEEAEHERDGALETLKVVSSANKKLMQERDNAKEDAEGYAEDIKELQEEIAALEKQADKAYEDGYSAAQKHAQQPKEVVREVVPADTERRIHDLEHLERLHSDDNAKLRKQLEDARRELDRAKDILGLDKSMREVQSDVQYLIAATNQYVRRYGGLTWTVERLGEVDDVTREELRKAIKNLATFSSALVASLEEFNG